MASLNLSNQASLAIYSIGRQSWSTSKQPTVTFQVSRRNTHEFEAAVLLPGDATTVDPNNILAVVANVEWRNLAGMRECVSLTLPYTPGADYSVSHPPTGGRPPQFTLSARTATSEIVLQGLGIFSPGGPVLQGPTVQARPPQQPHVPRSLNTVPSRTNQTDMEFVATSEACADVTAADGSRQAIPATFSIDGTVFARVGDGAASVSGTCSTTPVVQAFAMWTGGQALLTAHFTGAPVTVFWPSKANALLQLSITGPDAGAPAAFALTGLRTFSPAFDNSLTTVVLQNAACVHRFDEDADQWMRTSQPLVKFAVMAPGGSLTSVALSPGESHVVSVPSNSTVSAQVFSVDASGVQDSVSCPALPVAPPAMQQSWNPSNWPCFLQSSPGASTLVSNPVSGLLATEMTVVGWGLWSNAELPEPRAPWVPVVIENNLGVPLTVHAKQAARLSRTSYDVHGSSAFEVPARSTYHFAAHDHDTVFDVQVAGVPGTLRVVAGVPFPLTPGPPAVASFTVSLEAQTLVLGAARRSR